MEDLKMTKFYYDDADDYEHGNRGRIEHEGKTYILETDAELTNRCLAERPAEDNFFEMSATAKDLQGNKHQVYWVFEDNGEETLENYDYSDVDRILEI